jgi:threonine aldolase
VVLDRDSSEGLHYLRKLTMQLASKMRFVSAQFVALLTDDLWLRNAAHANAMATRLRTTLESAIASGAISDVSFSQPTQTNAVFAVLPPEVAARVREEFAFYDWNASTGEVRWMCAYDTTEADVDRFVACLVREVAAQRELARVTGRP